MGTQKQRERLLRDFEFALNRLESGRGGPIKLHSASLAGRVWHPEITTARVEIQAQFLFIGADLDCQLFSADLVYCFFDLKTRHTRIPFVHKHLCFFFTFGIVLDIPCHIRQTLYKRTGTGRWCWSRRSDLHFESTQKLWSFVFRWWRR